MILVVHLLLMSVLDALTTINRGLIFHFLQFMLQMFQYYYSK